MQCVRLCMRAWEGGARCAPKQSGCEWQGAELLQRHERW